jgi:hypothetical protein
MGPALWREGLNNKYFTKFKKEKKEKLRLTFFIESLDPPPALDELQFPYKDGPQIHNGFFLAIIIKNNKKMVYRVITKQ